MSTIGDDLLRDARRRQFGPRIEALVVYNSNPVAVAPRVAARSRAASRARTCSPSCSSTSMTDTADHRRLRAAGDDAARAPRRPHQLRPHLCADQRAGDRAARRGASRTRRSSASWRARMGFDEPCFADSDETLCARIAFRPERGRLRRAARARLGQAAARRGAVRRGRLPDAERASACSRRAGGIGVPDHVPNYESARAPGSPRAIRWR